MDRRSWPWKKKSSDKAATEKVIATLEAAGSPSSLAGSHVCTIILLFKFSVIHNFLL